MEWLVSHAGAGLFADPGTGKTAIVERAVLAIKDAGIGGKTLVVAPLRVMNEVWPEEAQEWIGSEWDRINELKMVVLHGKNKDLLIEEDADIYAVNFDGLKWLLQDPHFFRSVGFDTLVIDESSKLKHTKTKRFKLLKPFLDSFARRWILTGSPNPNGYLDLFGQIYILDLGRALGRYISHFRFNYFTPLDKFGWTWVMKKSVWLLKGQVVEEDTPKAKRVSAEVAIQQAIAPYIFRLDAGDYLKLPKFVPNMVRVELPPNARKIYNAMEEQMIAEIENHTVLAVSKGVALGKCAQIANGGLFHMEEDAGQFGQRTWTNIHEAKIEAVLDLVEELQKSPVLVVYDFKHDLDRLLTALGKDTPYIGGGVNATKSKNIIAAWNADMIPVLLAQPKTISHGLNMQYGTAHHIIWHSLTYDREEYDQLNKRLLRQGSRQKNIFVHHIIARDTTDEARMAALKKKGNQQQAFLDALRAYTKGKRK